MEIKYFHNPLSYNCCQCTDCLKPHLKEFDIDFIDITITDDIPKYILHAPSIHIILDKDTPFKSSKCNFSSNYSITQIEPNEYVITLDHTIPSAEDIKKLIQKIKRCILKST